MNMKIITFCAALATSFLSAMGAAAAAGERPVLLNPQVLVEEPIVRLSDLFIGLDPAGQLGDTPVAKAPAPGRTVELDARWLAALARAYAIDWQPRSLLDTATVERTALIIEAPRIEAALRAALANHGITGNLRLDLDHANERLVLPSRAPDTLAVADLTYDKRSGRFYAQLVAGGQGEEAQRLNLTGLAREIAEIPVPARRLDRGEVITQDDIEWQAIPVDEIGRNFVTDPDELVGMTPRRSVAAGRPLRTGDVRLPVVIEKGSVITIELVTERMRLSVQGRALEDGTQDQAIRVMNTQSNKTVTALVRGPDIVVVTTAALTASLD